MIIHKSHSKNDLIDLINDLNLKVVFSHQDNKKSIQDKLLSFILKESINIEKNYYNIENKDGLIKYLQYINPKKILNIKEKKNLMNICKHIIGYCKNEYDLEYSKYNKLKDLEDDMDYIKQFGDVPSIRRACRLMNQDPKFKHRKFNPFISPQLKKELDEKLIIKKTNMVTLKIRKSTPDNPIILEFT